MSELRAIPIEGLPEVAKGAALGELIAGRLDEPLVESDAIVISQKVVSKAEGRVLDLASVEPGARAVELADKLGKDSRLVELILSESAAVIRAERGILIVRTTGGLVCANAGIDSSNVPGTDCVDWRGRNDRDGREHAATEIGIADEVAALADLVRDKTGGVPAVLVRGLGRYVTEDDGPGAASIHRPVGEDLFS